MRKFRILLASSAVAIAGLPPSSEWNDMNLRWPGTKGLVFPSSGSWRRVRRHRPLPLRTNFQPELQKSVDNL